MNQKKIDHAIKNIRVYDNRGESLDRYTVIYMNKKFANGNREYVGCCFSGKSFFQHGEIKLEKSVKHLGKKIKFETLDQGLQNMILNDYWSDK